MKRAGVFVLACSLVAPLTAAEIAPARVFFADANLSVAIPEGWRFDTSFPLGPLFQKGQDDDAPAITCRVSKTLNDDHLSSDVSYDVLRSFELHDIASVHPNARINSSKETDLAGHHALEVLWTDDSVTPAVQHQSDYFFNINRVYALSLDASSTVFSSLTDDFTSWLASLRFLSRHNTGALDTPAHGGIWIQETAGLRVTIPDHWLIGVASDRLLGATTVDGDQHSEWTATADPSTSASAFTVKERTEARQALEKKGYQVIEENEEPFHDLPAYRMAYQATINGRFVKGQDLWVAGTKGRWLFNFEADGVLFNHLADDYKEILDDLQFL